VTAPVAGSGSTGPGRPGTGGGTRPAKPTTPPPPPPPPSDAGGVGGRLALVMFVFGLAVAVVMYRLTALPAWLGLAGALVVVAVLMWAAGRVARWARRRDEVARALDHVQRIRGSR